MEDKDNHINRSHKTVFVRKKTRLWERKSLMTQWWRARYRAGLLWSINLFLLWLAYCFGIVKERPHNIFTIFLWKLVGNMCWPEIVVHIETKISRSKTNDFIRCNHFDFLFHWKKKAFLKGFRCYEWWILP